MVRALRKLTGGGADYAFECVGRGDIVAQAYGALGKGGTAVVVGVAPPKDQTSISTSSLTFSEKTLTGSYFGSARPQRDFPRLLALYRSHHNAVRSTAESGPALGDAAGLAALPTEEVSEFIQQRANHFPDLEQAVKLKPDDFAAQDQLNFVRTKGIRSPASPRGS